MTRFNVVGFIAIVSGLLILLSGVRQTDEDHPGVSSETDSRRPRERHQVTLSLCGFLLVAAGLALMHSGSTTEQPGPCSFADSEEVQRDTSLTRCYHGAPRRPRP
jgi:uncharacterized membrane protein